MRSIQKGTSNNRVSYLDGGILITKATIVDAKDITGVTVKGWTPDVAVELSLDVGASFYPTLRIMGSFNGSRWGSAFKIRELFLSAGIEGELEDDKIPPTMLEQLKGKEIKRLSYVTARKPNGKLKFYDWDLVFPADADNEKIIEIFKDSLTKSTRLSENFKPELWKNDTETETEGADTPTDMADNLPF